MTISTVYAPDTYAGNGVLDTFAITFPFLSVSTNVKVSIKVDSTNVITTKTAATHYNISGSNVVFTAGNIPASGETVIIELNPDFKQGSDYRENDDFPADTVETDLDERCLEGQINKDLISRAIKINASEDASAASLSIALPSTGTEVLTLTSAGVASTATIGSLLTSLDTTNFDASALSGSDTTLITGTAGTSGDLAQWNVDGDLVDGPTPPTGTIVGTSDTQTLTNKTLNIDNNTLSNVEVDNFKSSALSGIDSTLITGTAGTSGYLSKWDANGDLIDGPIPPSGTIVGTADTQTLTNKTLTSPVINTGVSGTAILDEDNMASDSATQLATQQSIKAYADTKLANVVEDTTPQLGGDLDVNGNSLVSTANGDITLNPNGTGNVVLGNYTLDGDQTVGAGQDNYVLTYDNGTGLISLEAAAGGVSNIVDDTTPQLGGQLDVNGNAIGDGTRELITFTEDASAVNHINIENEATGSGPYIRAAGDDTNIDLNLQPKGTGNVTVSDGTDTSKKASIELSGATTAKTLTLTSSHTDNRTITLPDATDTLVGRATTDTLTNKTIDTASNTITIVEADISDLGSYITASSTDTLTNKTINTASNTITVVEADISDLGSYITDVVSDTTPQLGGQLDVNGNAIGDGTRELLTFTEDASAVNHINIENEATGSGPIIRAAGDDANVDLNINAKGTGNISLGNFTFDADQTVGAGQDNYVLTYDNGAGTISLEASAGGGLSNVVEDTSPQLGGQLDVNGNAIGDGTRELLTFTEDASAVNHVNIENEATGSGPIISAAGDDTNVDLNIAAKGTGNISIGNFTFDADQTVGAGQDNYVLTYDNAGGLISLEAAAGGGGDNNNWTEVTSTAASTDTVIDFTGLTSYDEYMFQMEDIAPATDNVALNMRISTDNGSSFSTSNYNYTYHYSVSTSSAAGTISWVLTPGIGNDTNENVDMQIFLSRNVEGSEYVSFKSVGRGETPAGSNQAVWGAGINIGAGANDVDAVRFYFTSGTISSGTIRVFGR